MPSSSVPRFRLWPVLLWGFLTYLVMAAFFGLFFLASDMLKAEALHVGAGHARPAEATWSLWVELFTLVLTFVAVQVWHGPLRRTFQALHRGRTPSPRDALLARRRIFSSPLVVGIGLPAVAGLVLVAVTLAHMPHGAGLPPETRALPVNLLFLSLTGFFSALWQRHRIQTRYLPLLFTDAELASRLPPSRDRGIGPTLVLLAIMSAVLPVAVVLTLLGTGVTVVPDTTVLTENQWALLLGDTALGQQAAVLIDFFGLGRVPVLLVNTIDTWRIVLGSALGVCFMLGYVFFVFRWAAGDLTAPLFVLRDAMKKVETGSDQAGLPVVANNEVGELTLGFNRMMKGLGERDRIKGLFGQYLTQEVSEAILAGQVNLGGDRYDVTVLFTDIRDFTALSDQLPPEEVFGFLNEYLDAMIEVLVARGGFIDKFLGDGILTVFGLPVRTDNHAEAAFLAASDMQNKLTELNARRLAAGKPPIAIGSGLHSGPVIAGNVGSSLKLQYTVIGDTVNLASRIEGMNKRWSSAVTLSEETWNRLPEDLRRTQPFLRETNVEIRGKKDPVTLYRLA